MGIQELRQEIMAEHGDMFALLGESNGWDPQTLLDIMRNGGGLS